MAFLRVSHRSYKFLRNSGLFLLGAIIVLFSLILPRLFKDRTSMLSYGPDAAHADGGGAGGGGGGGGGVFGDGSTGDSYPGGSGSSSGGDGASGGGGCGDCSY